MIHPFGQGSVRAAAISWSVFNLVLLAATAWALGFVTRQLPAKRRVLSAVWPHCVLILLLFAPASLQVGQFSILFTACWVFYLALLTSRWRVLAGAALAVPSAIKIYPLLLLGVPALSRRPRVVVLSLLFCVLATASPLLLYGARTGELTTSFWHNAIASSSGRVAEAQTASSPANQGLDSVAFRYLTANQPIQTSYPALPHLALPVEAVTRAVNVTRVVVLALSLWIGVRFWRCARRAPLWGEVMFMALMCAALYVILPGAKARYAIYAFPAFWPLLCCAFAARRLNQTRAFWAWSAWIIACCVLVGLTPAPWRPWGVGLAGTVGLWATNLALLWRWSRSPNVISRHSQR